MLKYYFGDFNELLQENLRKKREKAGEKMEDLYLQVPNVWMADIL